MCACTTLTLTLTVVAALTDVDGCGAVAVTAAADDVDVFVALGRKSQNRIQLPAVLQSFNPFILLCLLHAALTRRFTSVDVVALPRKASCNKVNVTNGIEHCCGEEVTRLSCRAYIETWRC